VAKVKTRHREDTVIKTFRSSPSIPDCESHFGGTGRTYSWRNAIIGSTLVARHAGR
jgi:hypothetical protein